MLSLSSIFSWSLNFTSLRKISTTPFVPILCLSNCFCLSVQLTTVKVVPERSISQSSLSLPVRVCSHSLFSCVPHPTQATCVPCAVLTVTQQTIPTITTTTHFLSLATGSYSDTPLIHHHYPMLIYPSYQTIYLYRPILFKVFHPVLPYRPSKHNLQTEPPVMSLVCLPNCPL